MSLLAVEGKPTRPFDQDDVLQLQSEERKVIKRKNIYIPYGKKTLIYVEVVASIVL